MCTSAAFILEPNRELDGSYERELLPARDFAECSNFCLNSLDDRGLPCRSFLFDDAGMTCILYDEDPLLHAELGQEVNKRATKSSAGHLYRMHCVNERGEETIPANRLLHNSCQFSDELLCIYVLSSKYHSRLTVHYKQQHRRTVSTWTPAVHGTTGTGGTDTQLVDSKYREHKRLEVLSASLLVDKSSHQPCIRPDTRDQGRSCPTTRTNESPVSSIRNNSYRLVLDSRDIRHPASQDLDIPLCTRVQRLWRQAVSHLHPSFCLLLHTITTHTRSPITPELLNIPFTPTQ